MYTRRLLIIGAAWLFLAALPASAQHPGTPGARWVGTWSTAVQLTEPRNLPPEPGLAGNTLRQVVHVSQGGEQLRVRFSNAFGPAPVTLTAAHLAVSRGDGAIDPATDQALSFGGGDGRGSGTNKQNRWPDELARRLQADERTRHVAVLNAGIGGNCVLRPCLGPSALDRFRRDVIDQSGARWLIILEGVNDIGGSNPDSSAAVAQRLIAAYQTMIERAHAADIRVYGATVMPFGDSFYDAPEHEAARQTVNAWMRTSGAFDAVIDLDAALRDPENPTRLLPAADTGDKLHPSEVGHRMMAEAVDLTLFSN